MFEGSGFGSVRRGRIAVSSWLLASPSATKPPQRWHRQAPLPAGIARNLTLIPATLATSLLWSKQRIALQHGTNAKMTKITDLVNRS